MTAAITDRLLMLCGVLAPAVYVGTVVLGGGLQPGYSHISQPVSDLIAVGAPHKSLLDALFVLYNLLAILFAIGLIRRVRSNRSVAGAGAGTCGSLVLMAQGLFGLLTLEFPEDAGGLGSSITTTGTLHIVFAGLSSLTTMLGMALLGLWFRGIVRLRAYAIYSFLSVGAVLLSGALAAASIAGHRPIGGLMERITIGGFLQWLIVIALQRDSSAARSAPPA